MNGDCRTVYHKFCKGIVAYLLKKSAFWKFTFIIVWTCEDIVSREGTIWRCHHFSQGNPEIEDEVAYLRGK